MTQIQSMEKNLIRLKTAWKRCRATKKTQNNNKEILKKKDTIWSQTDTKLPQRETN